MKDLTKDIIKSILRPRIESLNKGDSGHAFLIAGNAGKMGSAVIASKACLRSGCGLLTVSVPQDEQLVLQATIPEAMLTIRENDEDNFKKFSAAGIGPGIGTTKESIQILTYLLREFKKPIVLDADALNIIAGDKKYLDLIPPNTILNPHPLEFDRLFGDQGSIELRMTSAMDNAKEYNITIVLKGHRTFITNGTESYLNTTGNAGLAKAGSGDALTGMITSFLAQGYSVFDAAIMSVYLHGLAADIALTDQSMESMLITDVIACFGKAFKEVLKQEQNGFST
jgi:NAD(P)H-hydrate epimerase